MFKKASRVLRLSPSAVSVLILAACGGNEGSTQLESSAMSTERASTVDKASVIAANQAKARDNHLAHVDHHVHMASTVGSGQFVIARPKKPGAPEFSQQFDGQYRPLLTHHRSAPSDQLVTRTPAVRSGNECVMDFKTPNLMQYYPGGATYWADRSMIPWLTDCGQGARLDLRSSKYHHIHLGFVDNKVEFCFSDPDATAAYVDEQGNCDLLDLNTLERTDATSHWIAEVFVLRANYQYSTEWASFDLNRIRIVRETGARVCYCKTDEPDSEGPWIVGNGGGTGSSASKLGGWYCWMHLGQGTWDLSDWAHDVTYVKITSSAITPSTFTIDDIHAVVH